MVSKNPIGVQEIREQRLLNIWQRHSSVVSFVAQQTGTYELLCDDRAGRNVPLLLATPSLFFVTFPSPIAGLVTLSLVTFIGLSVLGIVAIFFAARRPATMRTGNE
jgi:hypothetical protein